MLAPDPREPPPPALLDKPKPLPDDHHQATEDRPPTREIEPLERAIIALLDALPRRSTPHRATPSYPEHAHSPERPEYRRSRDGATTRIVPGPLPDRLCSMPAMPAAEYRQSTGHRLCQRYWAGRSETARPLPGAPRVQCGRQIPPTPRSTPRRSCRRLPQNHRAHRPAEKSPFRRDR